MRRGKILPWRRRPWWRRSAPRWLQGLVFGVAIIAGIGIAQQLSVPVSSPGFEFAAPVRAQEQEQERVQEQEQRQEERIRLRVIDGDTVEVRGTGERVRLANIDTPETGGRERCAAERRAGERATSAARRFVNGAKSVNVRRTGREDQYGRTIGFVEVDGRDLGRLLVDAGLARPWRGRRESWCAADGSLLP